jgi:hypothetical protein
MKLEAASRKRGRPRLSVFSPEYEKFVLSMFPDIRTARGQQNTLYRQYAVNVLSSSDVPASWLFDAEKCEAGAPGSWCSSVLVELGRSLDRAWIVDVAKVLAARPEPKNVKAVAAEVKRARGARKVPALGKSLALQVLDLARRYQTENRGTTLAQVEDDLRMALAVVQAQRERQPREVYDREQAAVDDQHAAVDRAIVSVSESDSETRGAA